MITLGIDVSHWNGLINFDILKNNTQYIFMKTTDGNRNVDTAFKLNQKEARRVGLLVGYYHFARPDLNNSPESEAQFFLDTVGQPKDGELLALDYECANQKQADVDWCKKWLDYVQTKTGVKCFIYLNQNNVTVFDWSKVVAGSYALWIAAYTWDPNKNVFKSGKFLKAAIQQWTNKQTVPGMPGATDGNVFFGSLETLKKYGYKTPVVVTPPTPQLDIRLSLLNQAGINDEPKTRTAIERYNKWDQLQNDLNNTVKELNALKNSYSDLKDRIKSRVDEAIDSTN